MECVTSTHLTGMIRKSPLSVCSEMQTENVDYNYELHFFKDVKTYTLYVYTLKLFKECAISKTQILLRHIVTKVNNVL